METKKCDMHMSRLKAQTEHLITIDDDFNLQGNKPEIEAKIKECGYIVIEKTRALEDRVVVNGALRFRLLYEAQGGCASTSDEALFEDTIAIEGVNSQDIIRCSAALEDLSVSVINSGKISVKAVICLKLWSEEITQEECISSLVGDKMQMKSKSIASMNLVSSKKDICRIRESVKLLPEYQNVGEIVWDELAVKNVQSRANDKGINVKGDLSFFCIYRSEKSGEICYFDTTVPFNRQLDINGVTQDMIVDIVTSESNKSLIARADENGEMRIMDGEIILDMDIRAYEENRYTVIEDAYSPLCEMDFKKKEIEYREFVLKNTIKSRLEDRFTLKEGAVIKILFCSGRSNIEDIIEEDGKISVEGAITADILYLDGDNIIRCLRCEMPFGETMETDCKEEISCLAREGTIGISASVATKDEIMVKCIMETEIFVFCTKKCEITEDIHIQAPDYEYIKQMPGIVGYIVKDGDTLWNIAKKYCTTMDSIMAANNLESSTIKEGMKLMVIKDC